MTTTDRLQAEASHLRHLGTLNVAGASVRLAGNTGWRAAMDDPEGLREAIKRTETVKDLSEVALAGMLHGLLPEARCFELRNSQGEVLSGRVRVSR